MPPTNKIITNTVGGEVTPLLYGRIDLPLYQKAMERIENFIALPQGGGRFRNGTMFVKNTRLNRRAAFIPFQFSDQQSYLIEATDGYFRFYKNNAAITESPKTLTALTAASPGVFTSVAHGFATGDEVFINKLVGPVSLNGRFFLVVKISNDTFSLTTIAGTAIDTSGLPAYVSGGTAARVYEITTPYREADIFDIQYAQSADTMYLAHNNYSPGKLTRAAHASWTLTQPYSRVSDPFTPAPKTISGVTQANPGVVTANAHGFVNGQLIAIAGVVGMTQLNGNFYLVSNKTANTFELQNLAGVNVDTTGFTAYSSAGTATYPGTYPAAVGFIDTARLVFGGTRNNPATIWASAAPTVGTTDFDNFAAGVGATDSLAFTLAPVHGKVDTIEFIAATSKFIVIGCFGSLRLLYGTTVTEPISPTSITAKSVNSYGAALMLPVSNGDSLHYIQRGQRIMRSIEYDFVNDQYTTTDRNLVSEHLTQPAGYSQLVEQQGAQPQGSPDAIWCRRQDGRILGLTYKQKEDISGWWQAYLGGNHVNTKGITQAFGKLLSLGIMPRPTSGDQVWFIVERKIGASTVRSVEYMDDQPAYPQPFNFLKGAQAADTAKYHNVLYEAQKDACHVDMALKYDGAELGFNAGATLTPAATTGAAVIFTSSASVFTAAMVGREIWKQYDSNGDGGGRAKIATYTSATQVTCQITADFDNVNAIAPGDWFLTTDKISGLEYLEGETVTIIQDGGVHPDDPPLVVANGALTIQSQSSKVIVGYPYYGALIGMNLDAGGITGVAEAKSRNIYRMMIRLLNTVGIEIGTDFYAMQFEPFRNVETDLLGRPASPFSGIKRYDYSDSWDIFNKQIVLLQRLPLPCTVLSFDLFMRVIDEG